MSKKKILITDLDHTILACDSFNFFLFYWFIGNNKIFLLHFIRFFSCYFFFKIRLTNNRTSKQKFLQLVFSKSLKKKYAFYEFFS
jgi:hypothetical protein